METLSPTSLESACRQCQEIIEKAGINPDKRVRDLTEEEVTSA